MKRLVLIFSIFFLTVSSLYAGSKDPVGVLFQVKGKVEYTKNGKKWKKVRRNKFLFSGYQIRVGQKGSGKVTIQSTGESLKLSPNSLIKVTKNGLQAKRGKILAAESTNKLMSGLMKKFTRSQSYTTVRRSYDQNKLKLETARKMTLSEAYPHLVWENLGNAYSYRLVLGDQVYHIPATDDSIVRVKIKPFEGKKTYKIDAIKGGKIAVSLEPFKKRGKETLHSASWLKQADRQQFQNDVRDIQKTYGESSFMLGSFFEKQDMWVAAMDQYRQYLSENPDEIEMSPYLFRVYKKLQLEGIYRTELAQWKKAMQE